MTIGPNAAMSLALGATVVIVAALVLIPLEQFSVRDRLATTADVLDVVLPLFAAISFFVVWLSRRRLQKKVRAPLIASTAFGGFVAAVYLTSQVPHRFLPVLWLVLGILVSVTAHLAWTWRTRKRARAAIVKEATTPAPTSQHVLRLGASLAADRVLESRLDSLRELCATEHSARAVAVLAFPDREKGVFRVQTVCSQSYEFQSAVRGLELPFFQIRTVADTYNRHVEAAATKEGRLVGRDERLRLYRKDLRQSASVCAYTALRNRPFIFRNAYSRCLVCRLEFLDDLPDEDRLRLQFTDMVGLPITTIRGIVAVVLVASVMGKRLEFPNNELSVVAASVGNVIECLANIPGLESHPATIAVNHAIPARKSTKFDELVSVLTPDFRSRVAEQVIDDAVQEHKKQVEGWCENRRHVALATPSSQQATS